MVSISITCRVSFHAYLPIPIKAITFCNDLVSRSSRCGSTIIPSSLHPFIPLYHGYHPPPALLLLHQNQLSSELSSKLRITSQPSSRCSSVPHRGSGWTSSSCTAHGEIICQNKKDDVMIRCRRQTPKMSSTFTTEQSVGNALPQNARVVALVYSDPVTETDMFTSEQKKNMFKKVNMIKIAP